MKIIFFIEKFNYFKNFAPIIKQFAINNDQMIFLYRSKVIDNKLILEQLKKFNLNSQDINLIAFRTLDALNEIIRSIKNVDYYIALNPINFKVDDNVLNRLSGKWCMIMHGDDSFMTVWDWKNFNFKINLQINYERNFFIFNQHIFDWHLKVIRENPRSLEQKNNYKFFDSKLTKLFEVGDIQIDSNIKKTNLKNFYSKLGIDYKQKFILYLPFPFNPQRNSETKNYSWQAAFSGIFSNIYENKKWTANYADEDNPNLKKFYLKSVIKKIKKQMKKNFMIIYIYSILYKLKLALIILLNSKSRNIIKKNLTEEQVLIKISNFCKKNKLKLVVKYRKKFPIIKNISKYADYLIDDEKLYYPSLLQESVLASEFVIGYFSTSVREVVALDKMYVNIQPDNDFFDNRKDRLIRHKIEKYSRYNYPGVVTNYKVNDFINTFENLDLSNFKIDEENLIKYKETYLGINKNNFQLNYFYNILQNRLKN